MFVVALNASQAARTFFFFFLFIYCMELLGGASENVTLPSLSRGFVRTMADVAGRVS